MKTRRRYLEDERLNHHCSEFVKERGGVAFFGNQRWRTELKRCVDQFEQVYGKRGRFQSLDERFADIYEDLTVSKNLIELRVEKSVNQLCYPWYEGSELAVQASKDAGYIANHWGLLKKQAISMVGDDPYHVARIADDYLLCLPGIGRRGLLQVMKSKVGRKMNGKNRDLY